MIAITGFLMIVILVLALVKFKMIPISVFATLPILAAFILGFGPTEVFTMTAKGIISVLPVAALFVGSITYFGIMSDAGLFDPPVNWLLKRIRPSVFGFLATTTCVAMIAHLDGSGTATIMITVPAMLPVAKKLQIRALPMAFMVTMTIGVMNFLPWGGPLGRAATVTGVDAVTLWKQIIPVQIFGIVVLFAFAWLVAKREEKLGYAAASTDTISANTLAENELQLRRPKLFLFNLILTILIIVLLFMGCPAFLPFLIGIGIALPVNYGKDGAREQEKRIKAHAPNVVPMILTIIGAGMFLGVLQGGGIIEAMARVIVGLIPQSLGRFLHIIMGIVAIPLSLVFEADTMNYGILPVVAQIGSSYGVSEVSSALSIAIGHNMGIGLCMTNATVYFALGLFGLEYGDYLKYAFVKTLAFSVILTVFAAILGVI